MKTHSDATLQELWLRVKAQLFSTLLDEEPTRARFTCVELTIRVRYSLDKRPFAQLNPYEHRSRFF